MTSTSSSALLRWRTSCAESAAVFARDVGHGLLEICHNTLALVGLSVVAILLFGLTRADLRHTLEQQVLHWLVERQEARDTNGEGSVADLSEPKAVERATATHPGDLPRSQAAVAGWLAKRYKVAPEPVSRLVQEAWAVGRRVGIEPTLVLAVMAVESSFNPFAQSPMGAQGLMQVMTRVHDDKYQAFGGTLAAFDPVTNLRVGVQVLKDCIAKAGGVEAGLRHYVGAALNGQDGGYVVKVLAEQAHLRSVSEGKFIAVNVPLPSYRPDAVEAASVPAEPSATGGSPPTKPGTPTPGAKERVASLR